MELNEEEGRGGVLWENWHFSNPSLEVRACCAVITDGAFFFIGSAAIIHTTVSVARGYGRAQQLK